MSLASLIEIWAVQRYKEGIICLKQNCSKINFITRNQILDDREIRNIGVKIAKGYKVGFIFQEAHFPTLPYSPPFGYGADKYQPCCYYTEQGGRDVVDTHYDSVVQLWVVTLHHVFQVEEQGGQHNTVVHTNNGGKNNVTQYRVPAFSLPLNPSAFWDGSKNHDG